MSKTTRTTLLLLSLVLSSPAPAQEGEAEFSLTVTSVAGTGTGTLSLTSGSAPGDPLAARLSLQVAESRVEVELSGRSDSRGKGLLLTSGGVLGGPPEAYAFIDEGGETCTGAVWSGSRLYVLRGQRRRAVEREEQAAPASFSFAMPGLPEVVVHCEDGSLSLTHGLPAEGDEARMTIHSFRRLRVQVFEILVRYRQPLVDPLETEAHDILNPHGCEVRLRVWRHARTSRGMARISGPEEQVWLAEWTIKGALAEEQRSIEAYFRRVLDSLDPRARAD